MGKFMPMRKMYVLLGLLSVPFLLPAQNIVSVGAGTDLHIAAGTSFYAGGLVLEPSASFVLNDNQLTRGSTVTQFTVNSYASRVFSFSGLTAPFSGSIRFYYDDGELNGLAETGLIINDYNGVYWQALTTASYDDGVNYVQTQALSNVQLRELALSDALHTLPLQWGPVAAWRQGTSVLVQWITRQESLVRDFILERSSDARSWVAAGSPVAANNNSGENSYRQQDATAPAGRLYYRIRQTDIDGRSTYSAIASVAAGNMPALHVFPNPTAESFRLQGMDAGDIVKVELFAANGARVQQWQKPQTQYNIATLSQGIYQLTVELRNGERRHFKLNKY